LRHAGQKPIGNKSWKGIEVSQRICTEEDTGVWFQKWLKDKGFEWSKIPDGRHDEKSNRRAYPEETLYVRLLKSAQEALRLT
jgi:hypothetical protein